MPQIDFRNGIYQGEVRDKLPHGHGFFFSIDLTFIIAYWEQGRMNGPAIIIYPSGSVYYGSIGGKIQNDLAVIEMARDRMKAYFTDTQYIAVTFPLLQKILKINSESIEVVGQFPHSPEGHPDHFKQIMAALSISQIPEPLSLMKYFEYHFKEQNDIYQSFVLTSTGQSIHFLGQQLQGLGIKLRPESTFGKQRIIEAGVLTKENQLHGLGYRSHVSVQQSQMQQGVFYLKQTINSYPSLEKRPTKCISVFLSHLKRSLSYRDQYVNLSEIKSIKQLIAKLQSNSLFEVKRENAHRILEDPISDDAVLSQIQRSRRLRRDQIQKSQINQSRAAMVSSKEINPIIYSREVINTIKEEIHRSIDKKRLSNSRSNGHINSYVKHSSPTKLKIVNQANPTKDKITRIDSVQRQKRRNSGSISTKKSPSKKLDKAIDRQCNKLIEDNRRPKYDDFSKVQIKSKKSIQRSEYQGKIRRKSPAPILKTPEKSKKQSSPKKKVSYIKELQNNEDLIKQKYEDKIRNDKFQAGKAIEASRANWKSRGSPDKKKRNVFTQNIFEER